MKKTPYKFDELKEFINNLEIGDTFLRKDIIKDFTSSIDNYRNYFAKARYIKTISLGKYEKIRNIPSKLTSSMLYKEAYFNKKVFLKDLKSGI